MISAVVAGAAGILIAPISPLTPDHLHAVRRAGARRRRRRRLPAPGADRRRRPRDRHAPVRGARRWPAQHAWMPQTGSAELVPLVVILVALLVVGRAHAASGAAWSAQPLGRAPRPRVAARPDRRRHRWSASSRSSSPTARGAARSSARSSPAIIGLSLVVVTGYAGQVSLAQLTLAGVGALHAERAHRELGRPVPARAAARRAGRHGGRASSSACPALRLRGLTLGVVTLALRLRHRGGVVPQHRHRRAPAAPRSPQPELFGLDLGIGTGAAFPRLEFGLAVPASRWSAWPSASPCCGRSALGSAMLAVRANERSAAGLGVNVVRVKVASFAIGVVHRRPRRQPARLPPGRRHASTRSPRSASSPCCRPRTSPASRRCRAACSPGSWRRRASSSSPLDRWVDLGEWFAVITGRAARS